MSSDIGVVTLKERVETALGSIRPSLQSHGETCNWSMWTTKALCQSN